MTTAVGVAVVMGNWMFAIGGVVVAHFLWVAGGDWTTTRGMMLESV